MLMVVMVVKLVIELVMYLPKGHNGLVEPIYKHAHVTNIWLDEIHNYSVYFATCFYSITRENNWHHSLR